MPDADPTVVREDGIETIRYIDGERHVAFNRNDGQLGLDLILPVYYKP